MRLVSSQQTKNDLWGRPARGSDPPEVLQAMRPAQNSSFSGRRQLVGRGSGAAGWCVTKGQRETGREGEQRAGKVLRQRCGKEKQGEHTCKEIGLQLSISGYADELSRSSRCLFFGTCRFDTCMALGQGLDIFREIFYQCNAQSNAASIRNCQAAQVQLA